MSVAMMAGDAFSKTICTICYEDLKPNVEDLQSISICGHVFHELCLQQWFEYSAKSKKLSCPVCKQGCTAKSVARLYFQSTGDPCDPVPTQSRSHLDGFEESPEVLRREVKRLESRVSGLNSALDLRQEELKRINEELNHCKEKLSKEVTLKVEASKHKELLQDTLQKKCSELLQTTIECSRLKEKNLALAKELAALKLVSDCNLEEEEIVKLASLGNEPNSQDTVDVLKRSLLIRNKNYTELMAKCSALGRGEARSLRKLEKAKEKNTNLKARVRELEAAIEEKDNEMLRAAKKASKRRRDESVSSVEAPINKTNEDLVTSNSNKGSDASAFRKPPEPQIQQCKTSIINLDEDENLIADLFDVMTNENVGFATNKAKDEEKAIHHAQVIDYDLLTGDGVLKESSNAHSVPSEGKFTSSDGQHIDIDDSSPTDIGVGLSLKNIRQGSSLLHDKKDASSTVVITEPGERSFVGGLLGPDGSNRYLGKWCKRAQNRGSTPSSSLQGSAVSSLISVGSDGRGGRVKVLRHPSQLSSDDKERSNLANKRSRLGNSTGGSSSFQSQQRCLQIEHFFGRVKREA